VYGDQFSWVDGSVNTTITGNQTKMAVTGVSVNAVGLKVDLTAFEIKNKATDITSSALKILDEIVSLPNQVTRIASGVINLEQLAVAILNHELHLIP
jgi:hypothetical protein